MQYFTLLTQLGAEKIAAATAANTTVNLTHIAVGDGNGIVPIPNASKTALVNEVFRTNLNDLTVDANNVNWITTEAYISSNDGNFWIREVGIFDIDGDLIAIGNYPETFKPVMADGVAKDLYIKVIIEVSSSDAITLQIDPSIVLATQDFVSEKVATKRNISDSYSKSEVNDLSRGFKNHIINGDFRISQRNNIETPISVTNDFFYIDRFKSYILGLNATMQRLTDQTINGQKTNTLKLVSTQTASGALGIAHPFEYCPSGKTVTLSAWVKSNNPNARLSLSGHTTSVSNPHTGSGDWEKLVITKTLSLNTLSIKMFAWISDGGGQAVSITQGDYLEIGLIQLEEGLVATTFEQRPIGLELSLCRRYFIKYDSSNPFFMTTTGWDTTTYFYGSISLPEELRVRPSASFSRANGLTLHIESQAYYSKGIESHSTGTSIIEMRIICSPNFVGKTAFIRFREISDWIAFDAEIY